VKMDPRVRTLPAALDRQLRISRRLVAAADRLFADLERTPAATDVAARRALHARALALYATIQASDAAPTPAMIAAAESILAALGRR
jgi:hypothetical protein